ncbi:acetyl-CoA carboxylase biotin carboxylase subunit family protein [Streptomyces sp. NPDC048603]|uniref:ATP-grasp domain-containing protein n=1 Tax=Streptomyces sp. NPDC048603 TaxID=3365577 RepID=UPI00371C8A48
MRNEVPEVPELLEMPDVPEVLKMPEVPGLPKVRKTQRMAFLRSAAIQRADPYIQQAVRGLAADGIEAGLFHTSGTAGDGDFPGYRERLDRGVTPRGLADAVAAWGADAAVSISLPCENALRDAAAKAFLDAAGIPTVMTPLAATVLLVDKWETKQLCRRAGLDVPDGFRADSDLLAGRGLPAPGYRDALRVQAERIGYPLMSKPVWDSTSMGIRTLHSRADLDAFLASPPEVSTVVEEVVEGDLCSVDIVGRPGSYRVLPLCWTGRAGAEPVFTFADLRWCGPREPADAAFAEVARTLVRLCGDLGVYGSVNVDMVHTGGRFVVLEVNPRIGGATTLSCAASGTNTFTALTRMARGLPALLVPGGGTVRRTGWAIEFLAEGRIPPAVVAGLRERVTVVTAHELVIDGTSHGDIVVFTLAEGEEAKTVRALTELHEATGFPAAGVLGKIRSLLGP